MIEEVPKLYSIYQKVRQEDGTMTWVGTHRLPVSAAVRLSKDLHEKGERIVWRLDGELGPSYKD